MNDVIQLVRQNGPTSIYIDVRIGEDGELLFSGQDIGEAPSDMFGDIDYEYFLSVPAAEKDRVLLALLEKFYAGNASVVSEFKELLESKGISFGFHTF